MKSDLDLLIELLEAEKLSLEATLKVNLQEHEYLSVYRQGEALLRVNTKLHRFKGFKGPLFEEEQYLERLIKSVDKFNDSKFLQDYWKEQIREKEAEIEKLRQQKSKYFNDSQEIDNALFDLYEKRLKKFRFHFSHRGVAFHIDFEIDDLNMLAISVLVDSLVNHDDPDDLETNQLHLFKNLGFKLNNKSDLLVYQYDMNGFKDAIAIKTLLSRIIYDIGYFGGDNQAKLEYLF